MHEGQTVTRAQLYGEVWTNPVRTVASRYGISDVGLAKVLKRHRIPVPGRGYWQQLRAGRPPRRRPLPPLHSGESEEVTVFGRYASPPPSEGGALPRQAQVEVIGIPLDLSDPHPLVAQADKSLRHSKANEQGILQARSKHRLDLRVTHGTLDRALRLMDGLIRGLEQRGMPVSVARGDETVTSASVDGEAIRFFLEERIQRMELPLAPEERVRSWMYSRRYEFVATGGLRLRIVDVAYLGVRQTWGDGKKRRLEGCLGSFVLGLQSATSALKRQRAERAERQRQHELERQRRMEVELARQLEETRARELQRQVAQWQRARLIRDYIDAVKAAGLVYLPAEVKMATLADWVGWAGHYAARTDPLTRESPGDEET